MTPSPTPTSPNNDFQSYIDEQIKKDPSLRGRMDEQGKVLDAERRLWDCARKDDLDGWEKALGDFEVLTSDHRLEDLVRQAKDRLRNEGEPGNPAEMIQVNYAQKILDSLLQEAKK